MLVNREKPLVRVEAEMAGVVVGEVVGGIAIADYEQLYKAEECACVAVAGVVLVFNDLLDRSARVDAKRLQLDLDNRHSVDQQKDVVPVVAVVSIDAQLADDLERVLTPIIDIDQRVVQRRAVIACERIAVTKCVGGSEDVGADDFI